MKENYSVSDYLSDLSETFNNLVDYFSEKLIKKLEKGEKFTDDDLLVIYILLKYCKIN